MSRFFELAIRLFGALILGVFAYVPLYICYGMLVVIVEEPSKFDWFFVVAFGLASALAYFLCLLTYRAATGTGRKSDGRLLPPAAMTAFFALLGLVGVAGIVLGVWQGKAGPVIGGVVYLLVVTRGVWMSRTQRNET
jgi:membrane associated rhomboid family serine protease